MSIEEIFKTIQSMIAEQFAVEPETISMETNLEEDLGADSVDLVERVMAMEEEFEIEVVEEELAGMKTVADAVNFIASCLK